MGLFDIFLSREKRIEKENKLLAKPNHTVAEVIRFNSFQRDEYVDIGEGESEWQSVLVAEVTLRYQMDGQWREEKFGPEQGYVGFHEGEQLIVQYGKHGIVHFKNRLRDDSPNRI